MPDLKDMSALHLGATQERNRITKILLKAYPSIDTWPCWSLITQIPRIFPNSRAGEAVSHIRQGDVPHQACKDGTDPAAG
ncbi:hypothetical protein ES703_79754 [subsurface metagenome]